MPCPNCGSHNLWDDSGNGYWGCNRCKAMYSPNTSNSVSPNDRFNQDDPDRNNPPRPGSMPLRRDPPSYRHNDGYDDEPDDD